MPASGIAWGRVGVFTTPVLKEGIKADAGGLRDISIKLLFMLYAVYKVLGYINGPLGCKRTVTL